MVDPCILIDFLVHEFVSTNTNTLSQFAFGFFQLLMIFLIQLHKGISLFHGLLHHFEFLSFGVNFFILFHLLFDVLCVFFFCHLILNSSPLCVSTESVIIGSNFFTTLVFKFGTKSSFTTFQGNQGCNRIINLQRVQLFQRFSVALQTEDRRINAEIQEEFFKLFFNILIMTKCELPAREF